MTTPDRRVVFVVGPGRSGTSTMAGALAHSGFHVPDPVPPNESNPLGFHEPIWVVDFHIDCLRRAGVRTLDPDPGVLPRMDRVLGREKTRRALSSWLSHQLADGNRLVIKDPRLVWATGLWVEACREVGVEPGFVIMLRHPSEVSSSRTEFYDSAAATGVAGWINVAILTERLTAGLPRSFVGYPDFMADWRRELGRVQDELGLELTPGHGERPHPVDDFLDPALRRRQPGWDTVPVSSGLADLADRAFDALHSLTGEGDPSAASAALAEVETDYARLYAESLAIVRGSLFRARDKGKRKARRTRASDQHETTAGDRS